MMTVSQEIETLIRARYPILYIVSSEEMRVREVVAGITLYGDVFDLEALHRTIHKIATEGFMEERTREFILALAYER